MKEMKKRGKERRTQNPFDDGADERLRRMGLFDAEGHTNNTTLQALSKVYAGQLFDELCDFYQDYSMVRDDLGQLFSAAKTADARQRFLLICLQYDALGQALPNPIWWISGNHVPVAFHTTPKEYEAITTSPTDLRVKRMEDANE